MFVLICLCVVVCVGDPSLSVSRRCVVCVYECALWGVSVVSLCRVSLPLCLDDVRVCDDSVCLSFCVCQCHACVHASVSLSASVYVCMLAHMCVCGPAFRGEWGWGSTVRAVTGQAQPGCPAPAPSHPAVGLRTGQPGPAVQPGGLSLSHSLYRRRGSS